MELHNRKEPLARRGMGKAHQKSENMYYKGSRASGARFSGNGYNFNGGRKCINSGPTTYVCDDTEGISYPLTPSHLINGRNLSHLPHDRYLEVVSAYETLSERAKLNRLLLGHFSKRWKNEYLLGLMEAYKPKSHVKEPVVSLGDVVLLKDDQNKRMFWKLCRIQELLPGTDGSVRSARVQVCTRG